MQHSVVRGAATLASALMAGNILWMGQTSFGRSISLMVESLGIESHLIREEMGHFEDSSAKNGKNMQHSVVRGAAT